jgi:hypothetical protein
VMWRPMWFVGQLSKKRLDGSFLREKTGQIAHRFVVQEDTLRTS